MRHEREHRRRDGGGCVAQGEEALFPARLAVDTALLLQEAGDLAARHGRHQLGLQTDKTRER